MRILLLSLLTLLGFGTVVNANNIQVTNVTLAAQNGGTATFSFDLAWDNSWNIADGPANHDAAWVFAKISVNGGNWQPLELADLRTGGNPVSIATLSTTQDALGRMLYRSTDGAGTNTWTGLEIDWDYDTAGVDDNAVLEVRLFATEMVNVPEGEFTLGNAAGEDPISGSFVRWAGNNPILPYQPYSVTSENAIPMFFNFFQQSLGYEDGGDFSNDDIPAAFPKGYAAFYCMKYELSQQQWVDFYNTLTPTQQANLDATGPDGKNTDSEVDRNGVIWNPGEEATTTLPDLPMNYLPNDYYYAYLDWAGMRPMSELEYEKSCRGPATPVAGEYAWGTSRINTNAYTLTSAGMPSERVTNPGVNEGNASSVQVGSQLLRCGIFAASAANANREETGGTYYGIMDMTGSLIERAISIGESTSRDFTVRHGDGRLTAAGAADVATWPLSTIVLSFRGGSFLQSVDDLRMADRRFGDFSGAINEEINGIRGAISAE